VEAPPAATARAAAASAAPTVVLEVLEVLVVLGALPEPALPADGPGEATPFERSPGGFGAAGDVFCVVDADGLAAAAAPVPGELAGGELFAGDTAGEPPDDELPDGATDGTGEPPARSLSVVTAVVAAEVATPGRSDPRVVSGRGLSSDELPHHLRGRGSRLRRHATRITLTRRRPHRRREEAPPDRRPC
jgi:hypothetical protein